MKQVGRNFLRFLFVLCVSAFLITIYTVYSDNFRHDSEFVYLAAGSKLYQIDPELKSINRTYSSESTMTQIEYCYDRNIVYIGIPGVIFAIDPGSGELFWSKEVSFGWDPGQQSTMKLSNQMLYYSGDYSPVMGAFPIYGFDLQNYHERLYPVMHAQDASFSINQGTVFTYFDNHIICYNTKTEELESIPFAPDLSREYYIVFFDNKFAVIYTDEIVWYCVNDSKIHQIDAVFSADVSLETFDVCFVYSEGFLFLNRSKGDTHIPAALSIFDLNTRTATILQNNTNFPIDLAVTSDAIYAVFDDQIVIYTEIGAFSLER